ncbi:hypothetical protein EVAR_32337_1 [Eumeta japonica]|uniref:Uncharacterized protein n=1 Tax=Eumeta variegata TaxID=151549 RepID=A0A4C1Z7B5_EUMVA|nr:hypothetical protein EVAR_32337_1 [Eumeta japonica]
MQDFEYKKGTLMSHADYLSRNQIDLSHVQNPKKIFSKVCASRVSGLRSKEAQTNVTAVSGLDTRPRIVTRILDMSSTWSLIRPGSARTLEKRRENPHVSTVARITRPTTEGARKHPKLTYKQTNKTDKKRFLCMPPSVSHDERNFPALMAKNSARTLDAVFRPVPVLFTNLWGENQPPKAVPVPPRKATRRRPLTPLATSVVTGTAALF